MINFKSSMALSLLLIAHIFLSLRVTSVVGLVVSYSNRNNANTNDNKKIHRYYILRHGQTDANAAGTIQGSSNFSRLTERGRQQAVEAGKTLIDILSSSSSSSSGTSSSSQQQQRRIDSIYVSPLARATETLYLLRQGAGEINRNLQLLPFTETIWNELRELDLHEWEGRNKDDLQVNDAIAWKAWKEGRSYDFEVSGRKPLVDVWDRASSVWQQLRQQRPPHATGASTLLVCHGTLGQALLNTALGRDASYFRDIDFPNCGLVEIQWAVDSPVATSWEWHHPPPESAASAQKWTLEEWEKSKQQQACAATASYAESLRERNLSFVA